MTLRQRFAVHFVGNKRGGFHCLFEAECLVIAVGSTEQHRRDIWFGFHLREEPRQRHAFPDRIRAESAANSIGNAKKRRLLFDGWHRCDIGKAVDLRVLDLADNVEPP